MKSLLWLLMLLIPLAGLGGLVCLGVAAVQRRRKSGQTGAKAGRLALGSFALGLGLLIVLPIASQCQYVFLDEKLVGAALENNFPAVRELVARGANVNAEGDDGMGTALVAALNAGNPAMVRYLIEHGADVNLPCSSFGVDVTPLQAASGHPEMVAILKAAGAKP